MHILMLSDLETQGGGAIATARLAEAFCRAGHRVTRLVARGDGGNHTWTTRVLNPSLPLIRLMVRFLLTASGREKWDNLATGKIQSRLGCFLKELRPDVINVHNLHGAVKFGWSPDLLRVCAEHAPTVWTLHDMWSFTGRCAYSYDCRKFITSCDATCPTPKEYPALTPKRIAGAWEQRSRVLSDYSALIAVTPSHWLVKEAQVGLWAQHRVEVIPYGLPLDIYSPVERYLARKTLGIEGPGPFVLTAAVNFAERRKGVSLLARALKRLSGRPMTLATLGAGDVPLELNGIRVHRLGYIGHEPTKVLAYNAADILVHPAPVDNFPNVVMEAIACGTPVVAASVGGLSDMVCHGQTGWLADEASPAALASVLERAFNDLKQGANLRGSCRAVAEAKYGSHLQAERYLKLFSSISDKHLNGRLG